MRIDRSRIRILKRLNRGGPSGFDAFPGLLIGHGPMEVEVWPTGAAGSAAGTNIFWEIMMLMLSRNADDEISDENLSASQDWFERRILEEVDRLSAHEKIAMVRDGLLISA